MQIQIHRCTECKYKYKLQDVLTCHGKESPFSIQWTIDVQKRVIWEMAGQYKYNAVCAQGVTEREIDQCTAVSHKLLLASGVNKTGVTCTSGAQAQAQAHVRQGHGRWPEPPTEQEAACGVHQRLSSAFNRSPSTPSACPSYSVFCLSFHCSACLVPGSTWLIIYPSWFQSSWQRLPPWSDEPCLALHFAAELNFGLQVECRQLATHWQCCTTACPPPTSACAAFSEVQLLKAGS